MKKNLLLLGMASVFALTGCHGTKKVAFKEFGDEVKNIDTNFEAKEVKVSGKVEDEKFKTFTVKIDELDKVELDDTQKKAFTVCFPVSTVATIYALCETAYALGGDEALKDYTFYIGNGFKVKTENKEEKTSGKLVYEKHGLLVHSVSVDKDGKKTDISLKWEVEEKKE